MAESRLRICPFCEATCGLEIQVDGGQVVDVRGDKSDVFSGGYVCPKGAVISELHEDPDRLRSPMLRDGASWRPVTWSEAFADIDANLTRIRNEHGNNAVGAYLGNPTVHNLALTLYAQALLRALNTHNIFSASTVDQFPKQLACGLLFGNGLSVPIPDLNRTDYLVILGANPLASNGSLMTAPDIPGRLRNIRKRGGKLVVIDPRRTKTAEIADEHHFIRPGTDAYLLFAIVHTLFDEELVRIGRLADFANGLDDVRALAAGYSPESVAERCGIAGEAIRRLARELAGARSAAIHARIGTCTQEFGTLASWLVEVIHVLTGNLDREGGAMFTLPAYGAGNSKGAPGVGKGVKSGRWTSRVRGLAEVFGELPVACLAEEIETPGEGQIRALLTVAGNPFISTPNGARLEAALGSLEYMVSLDIYLNETTRFANVILPGLSPLETAHYDIAFSQLAIHNFARYSKPVFPKPEGQLAEWETVLRLMGIVSGMGPDADIGFIDDMVAGTLIQREIGEPASVIHGRDMEEIVDALKPRRGPERLLDFMLRTGPYGDGFGARSGGLTLETVEASPHGVDLGPLKSRLPEVLRTRSGKIELAPVAILEDERRLRTRGNGHGTVLIGRRDLRSNNSWMHNLPLLATGKPRCTLHIHPDDVARLGLEGAERVRVSSRVGEVELPIEPTEGIMPGVVSIPHGWGHDGEGISLSIAQANPGVNSNRLTDEALLDGPSGTAVLCGIPVSLSPVAAPAGARV